MSFVGDVNISQARARLSELVDDARSGNGPVYVARRGRRVAAVIDADDLEHLIDLAEDMVDIRAAAEARAEMAETAATPVPWDEVKADLGLS